MYKSAGKIISETQPKAIMKVYLEVIIQVFHTIVLPFSLTGPLFLVLSYITLTVDYIYNLFSYE
jgi:hypothetical protein